MSKTPSLPRNTLYSTLSAGSNLLLLVLVVLAARVLGDSAYGKFSFALAVASIFEMPIDFGLNTLTVKNVARRRELAPSYLHAILPWKLLLSMGAMALLVPVGLLLASEADLRLAIYAMGLAIVLRTFKSTSHSFFRAHERFDLVLLTTYTERLAVVALCVLMLFKVGGLMPFVLAFAVARIPDLFFSYWLLHKKIVRLGWRWDATAIRRIQVQALPFGSLNIVMVLYAYIGTVVLGVLRTTAEVGWYSAGYKIYEGLTMFPYILYAVLLPRLSNLYVTDNRAHGSVALRAVKYAFVASLPLAVCGWLLTPSIISTLFGQEYMRGVPALRALFAAFVLMFPSWMLNAALVSADRQGAVLKIAAIGLAVNGVASYALITTWGVLGAGVAMLAAEACVLAMLLATMHRRLFAVPIYALVWRPVSACIVAGGIAYWLQPSTALAVVAFPMLYVVSLLVLRTFDAKEWSELKHLFRARVAPPR